MPRTPQPSPGSPPANLDDSLDALLAAPRHHSLLFENDHVRVLDTHVSPGDTVPLHTHRWPGTHYIVTPSDFIRRDAAGAVLLNSRTRPPSLPGTAAWSDPLPPHTLENIGASELRVITVELKSPDLSPPHPNSPQPKGK
jgi:hypothetical protein